VIDNPHQRIAFIIVIAGNGTNERPGWFLDENNVEVGMGLKDCFDDEIVFLDILQKDFEVF